MSSTRKFDLSRELLDAAPARGSLVFLFLVCLAASIGGLLFGFDTAVISGTVQRVQGQYDLSDFQTGWFTSSALVGCIFGAAIGGMLGDRFGRKPILRVAAVFFFLSALFSAIPPTFNVLIGARILGGMGVGMASVLAPMYVSEFAPPKWRGRLVALYQLSIVIGILAAYFSNYQLLEFCQSNPSAFGGTGALHWIVVEEVWRGMFGVEMIPAGLFFLILFCVPESPRWLAREGHNDRAFTILARVAGRDTARREMAEIHESLRMERGTIRDLFQPGLRTALLVGVMLSVFGQLSGVNIVVYYGPSILAAAGFEDTARLLTQVGVGLINLIFTVIAMLFIDRVGRRPLLIGGMAAVTIVLFVIGALFLSIGNVDIQDGDAQVAVSRTMGIWIGVMICTYMASIALSISAVIWVLTPEIFPNRVRGRAVSICTFANWSTNASSALIFPPLVASFGMHTAFFASAAVCLVATVFFQQYVPETKGRSLEEIERQWLSRAIDNA